MRDFFASCPKGLEYLLVDELKSLGAADAHEALAGVYFRGALDIGYRACLWSRLASRVFMPIADYAVEDGDQLYDGAKAIAWSHHLADGKTEVFWGHTKSLADARRKKAAAADASKQRKWQSHAFEIAELEKSFD